MATLAGAYRDRAAAPAATSRSVSGAIEAVRRIQEAGEALIRNPNEALLLQALLLRVQAPH